MATFRFLHTDFWRDNFFLELTPEDKYFYIYLLTNDRCSQCGIYNFGVKFAAVELGYSIDTVKTLLERFIKYGKILYDEKNGEIMILNWYKYNININNKNSRICINTCIKSVKTVEFIRNLYVLCSEKYKDEMKFVNEIFSGVSFSQTKDSIAIIENNKGEAAARCSSNSEVVGEIIEGKPSGNVNKSEKSRNKLKDNKLGDNGDKSEKLVEFCDENVDKFKDKEADCGKFSSANIEEGKVIEIFQNNFHPLTPIELEKLRDWCSEVGPQVVVKAIEVATFSNKRNMTYLNGILRNWFESGVRNIEDYERVCKENEKAKDKEKKKEEILPQYKEIPVERYDDEGEF